LLKNQLRIIGGKWRGRKLDFPNIEGLRPTPSRVRETLFNWLAPDIHNADCLDLFAGSGALGFEALSRGANKVIFIDSSKQIIDQLKNNCQLLNCDAAEIHQMDSEEYLKQTHKTFAIVFLDPPFKQNLILKYCKLLTENNLLKPNAYIYIETELQLKQTDFPDNLQILKQKKAGKVNYLLIKFFNSLLTT